MSHFPYHTTETATGEAKELLDTINTGYGFVPNLFGYMAEAPATLKAYLQLNTLLAETSFTGAQLQVALLKVSLLNKCDFCAVAHQAMAKKFSSNEQSVQAVLDDSVIEDTQDKAIITVITSIVNNKGWTPAEDLQAFWDAGFTQKHYLELILVVTIKTLSNYINHQTTPEVNPELLSMIS
jgi:uncharacterized peroxidase-related enzyme